MNFIGDAGHDKVFLDLKVEGGKDVMIVKAVCCFVVQLVVGRID